MIRYLYSLTLLIIVIGISHAQEHFPINGVDDPRQNIYLLDNATIIPDGDKEQFVGDILIKEGRIHKIAEEINSKGAVHVNLTGYYVYPSFIDLYAQYGIDPADQYDNSGTQLKTHTLGAYGANEAIRAEFRAHEAFLSQQSAAEEWRKAGFGALVSHRKDGISRGSGCLVALADKSENEVILEEVAANYLSIRKGSSAQDYPGSKMGAIALLRQTYLDGEWYTRGHKDVNLTLDSWNELLALPHHSRSFKCARYSKSR